MLEDLVAVLLSAACLCYLFSFFKFKISLFFQFGFRKWKGNVTERPIEDRSDVIKELYSNLTIVKPQEGLFFPPPLYFNSFLKQDLRTYAEE